jgi:hypothetical protein
MRDRLESVSQLQMFSQNVNRNYVYVDSLLAELYEHYDLLFIQEPPWRLIRSAPSSASREGADVIGGPLNPNWGCLVRPRAWTPRHASWFILTSTLPVCVPAFAGT